MNDLKKVSQKLLDLILFALNHGIESIKDGAKLIPFSIVEYNKERKLDRFITETLKEGKKKAEEHIKKLKFSKFYAVVVYEGFVTMNGKKYDAVLAKGYSDDGQKGYLFAQRYKLKNTGNLEIIGNPGFLGCES